LGDDEFLPRAERREFAAEKEAVKFWDASQAAKGGRQEAGFATLAFEEHV
jgi:hypothetical protein